MSSINEEIVTQTVTEEQKPTETVEAVVLPVAEPVELLYEYQPTDEDGRPIGGKQVIKYRTQEELVFKLTNQSVHQIRKMRDQERKLKLGIVDEDKLDEQTQQFQSPIDFNPKDLTPDQQYSLAQSLGLDPENFDKVTDDLFEAKIGVNPQTLRDTLRKIQDDNITIKALREVDKFQHSNPDYIVCPENSEAITKWILRYNLAPTETNFQKAYDTLKAAGVLVTSVEVLPQPTFELPASIAITAVETPSEAETIVREEIPIDNQVPVELPKVETPRPVATPSRIPSGLNNGNSTSAGTTAPIGEDIVYEFIQRDGEGRQVGEKRIFKGMAALNAMPSEEYKRRLLHERGFAQKVEKLNQEVAKKSR